jgi:hypothetical protein
VLSEAAIDIDRAGDRWLVLVAKFGVRGLSHLIVYSSTADDLGGLTVLHEFPMTPGPPHLIGMADTFVGRVTVDTYYLHTADLLHKLDLVTMQWSSVKPAHRISAYSVSSDGKLLTAVHNQGAFSKVSVSDDGGTSWRSYKRPPYTIYDVHMETPESGTAARWNAHAFTSTLEFLEFDPAKKEWRKTHEAPQGCAQMLRDASYAQQYCLTSGGSILSYKDGSWVVEFALN